MVGSARPYDKLRHISVAIAVAMTAIVFILIPPDARAWQGIVALAVLAIGTELLPVNVGKTMATVTITAPIHWTVLVLFGPAAAILVALTASVGASILGWTAARILVMIGGSEAKGRLPGMLTGLAGHWVEGVNYPFSWVFSLIVANSALDMIIVGSTALVYRAVGGHVLTVGYFEHNSLGAVTAGFIAPFILSLITFFITDEIRYVTNRICLGNRPEDLRDWYSFVLRCRILLRESVPLTWRPYILLSPITVLLVYLYLHVGVWSGLVVFGPFFSFRLSVQKAVEQEEAYMATIATLGTYMQHYHPYTRGHLKRVADMSERIARELRLPAETIMLIPYAGLLHDIGKVGVSEEILDKTEKLTDEEWATIKEHPVKGAGIVEHLEFLDRTVDWIKYHHKWENGAGYPENGLKPGGIPIQAAIIAVADAFDAMTDDREMTLEWACDSCGFKPEDGERPEVCPNCGASKRRTYRQPLGLEQAINELRRGAGSQFRAEVVKAFLRMVDREGIKVGGSG